MDQLQLRSRRLWCKFDRISQKYDFLSVENWGFIQNAKGWLTYYHKECFIIGFRDQNSALFINCNNGDLFAEYFLSKNAGIIIYFSISDYLSALYLR